jgi:hypothetical protein
MRRRLRRGPARAGEDRMVFKARVFALLFRFIAYSPSTGGGIQKEFHTNEHGF